MYFQVYSNSAYPIHSGERYRTIRPLVLVQYWKLRESSTKSRDFPDNLSQSLEFRYQEYNLKVTVAKLVGHTAK